MGDTLKNEAKAEPLEGSFKLRALAIEEGVNFFVRIFERTSSYCLINLEETIYKSLVIKYEKI